MLTRYEPWGAVRQIQDEINRAFGKAMFAADDSSSAATSNWTPAVDIKEEDGQFVLSADVPGVAPEAIEITMDNGVLTLKGERKFESEEEGDNGYRRVERMYGTFHRQFALPDTAEAENISAKGENGVLKIMIPKKVAVQPKRIKVDA